MEAFRTALKTYVRILILPVLAFPIVATAQWTTVNLHPAGASYSILWSVWGGNQAGEVGTSGQTHAGLWSGTSGSFLDLHPDGATFSRAYGVYGNKQVGFVRFDGRERATLWNGSPTGYVDLHPNTAGYSIAYGLYENTQVGQVDAGAASWSGSKETLAMLGAGIRAQATYGGSHVGYRHSAVTWIKFWGPHTTHFDDNTRGLGFHGYQMVGRRHGRPEAYMWTTTDAFYNLVPQGSTESSAFSVHAGSQVGYATINLRNRACIWASSNQSYTDLHAYLPVGFTDSKAHSIWHDRNGVTYIAGYGSNGVTKRDEAMLWVSTAQISSTQPTGVTLVRGQVVGGSPASLNASDDNKYVLRPGVTLSTAASPIVIEVAFSIPTPLPTTQLAVIESGGNPAVEQLVEVYNYETQGFNVHDQQRLTFGDRDILSGLNPVSRFVSPEGIVRIRISYRALSPVLSFPWSISLDEIGLRAS